MLSLWWWRWRWILRRRCWLCVCCLVCFWVVRSFNYELAHHDCYCCRHYCYWCNYSSFLLRVWIASIFLWYRCSSSILGIPSVSALLPVPSCHQERREGRLCPFLLADGPFRAQARGRLGDAGFLLRDLIQGFRDNNETIWITFDPCYGNLDEVS